jgi:hypothetical protein
MTSPTGLHRVPRSFARFPVLVAAALMVAAAAETRAAQPSYDLQVAFDIGQAKIIDTATIDAGRGTESSIDRGDRTVRSACSHS